jgi:hypothetical protein
MNIVARQQHAFNHAVIRKRLIPADWVVIRRSDGLRKSVPVYRRRVVSIASAGGRP